MVGYAQQGLMWCHRRSHLISHHAEAPVVLNSLIVLIIDVYIRVLELLSCTDVRLLPVFLCPCALTVGATIMAKFNTKHPQGHLPFRCGLNPGLPGKLGRTMHCFDPWTRMHACAINVAAG